MSYEPPSDRPSEGTPTTDMSGSTPQGGYTPPPAGGYASPPPGGGYAPPPPPPGQYAAPDPYGYPPAQAQSRNIFLSYLNAVIKPTTANYASEVPNAGWGKTLIGVLTASLLTGLFILAVGASIEPNLPQIEQQIIAQDNSPDVARVTINTIRAIFGGGGAVTTFLLSLVSFFVGAGILYLLARLLGGQGSGFTTHSYLLSISYTPLRILLLVLLFVPILQFLALIALPLYQLFCAAQSMTASQRLTPSKALAAAFLSLLVFVLLGCFCSILSSLLSFGR